MQEEMKTRKVQSVVVRPGKLGEVGDESGKRVNHEVKPIKQSKCKLLMIIRISGRVGYCRQ